MQDVRVTVACPANYADDVALSKTRMRSRDVSIVAVNWETARFWCRDLDCGYFGDGP